MYKPGLDVRIHVLPVDQLIIPHRIHARGQPMHSFVGNFQQILTCQMSQSARSLFDITGTPRIIGPHSFLLASNAAIGDVIRGIVVGAGMTPPTADDYRLGAKYLHGTIPGTVSYAASTFVAPYIVGDITYSAVIRIITNLSGAPLTIYEVGWNMLATSGTIIGFLAARDLLLTPLTLANGQGKQFIYTLATEV